MQELIVVIGNNLENSNCIIAVYDLGFVTEEQVRNRYRGTEYSFDKVTIERRI